MTYQDIFGIEPTEETKKIQDEKAAKAQKYCAQGKASPWPCRKCSLVNYGRDCHNNPVAHTGYFGVV